MLGSAGMLAGCGWTQPDARPPGGTRFNSGPTRAGTGDDPPPGDRRADHRPGRQRFPRSREGQPGSQAGRSLRRGTGRVHGRGDEGGLRPPPRHRHGLGRGLVMTTWVYDDGGRAAAGFRGVTGDCVVRAVAIATQLPYQRVYDDLNALGLAAWEGRSARQRGHDGRSSRRRSQSRTGVERAVYEPYLAHLGFRWTPTMSIGAGTTVHLRADELLPPPRRPPRAGAPSRLRRGGLPPRLSCSAPRGPCLAPGARPGRRPLAVPPTIPVVTLVGDHRQIGRASCRER